MKEYKPFITFIVKVLCIYILWFVVYEQFLGKYNYIDDFLTRTEASLVAGLFELFGYSDISFQSNPPDASEVYWAGKKIIGISDSCNGLVLFVIFAGFVISFPSKWKHRLIYIPFGIVAIYFLNIIRIFSLALIFIYYPYYLDFNHHYTFTFFVYMDIFLLWMAYVKKYGKLETVDATSS